MTKQKSFKGRVRARMDKTSESYTTARRQLLAKAGAQADPEAPTQPAEPAATPPGDAPEAKRPYSEQAIRANTGRGWDEWFALLDEWGGAERPHPEIVRWLVGEHGCRAGGRRGSPSATSGPAGCGPPVSAGAGSSR